MKSTAKNTTLGWWLCGLALAGSLSAGGPGLLKVDESSISILESAAAVQIVVERSQGEDGEVSVDYWTEAGSAADGSDYQGVSGTLVWPALDGANRIVEITLFDDAESEPTEDLIFYLGNATGGATIDPERGSSTVFLLDDDGGTGGGGGGDDSGDDNGGGGSGGDDGGGSGAGSLKFDQRTFYASEASALAVITVERSHGESGAITVDFATQDGSAVDGVDYYGVSGTLSWEDGDESDRTFMVEIVDDGETEGSETVDLLLSNPTGGAVLDDERSSAVLTILDDGTGDDSGGGGDDGSGVGTFKFDPRSFQVTESGDTATVTVERSHGSQGAVTVELSTADGSATEGVDYAATFATLFWTAGEEGRKAVSIPIFQDDLSEGNETVLLSLGNPTGGADIDPDRGTATLTILDDDGSTAACQAGNDVSCLSQSRFQVDVTWRLADGRTGKGQVTPVTGQTSLFWFFSEQNVELLVKVLDGCNVPGLEAYWVFTAGLTNVDYTLTVTDTATGLVKEYVNPLGREAAPVQDTLTFRSCP